MLYRARDRRLPLVGVFCWLVSLLGYDKDMTNKCDCSENRSRYYGQRDLRQPTRRYAPKCECEGVIFTTKTIPAALGTSAEGQPFAPTNGKYFNTLLKYQADNAVYLYDSAGVPTCLREADEEES